MDAFPNLTPAENENLVILSEECAYYQETMING